MGKDREIRHLHEVSVEGGADFVAPSVINDILRQEAVWADLPADFEEKVMHEIRGGPTAVVPIHRRKRQFAIFRGNRFALAASVALLGLSVGIGASVLDNPQGANRHVELAASPLAPDSRADVALSDTPSGVKVELDLHGLPPAPVGSYYEGWVTGDRGMVAIGTFHLRHGTKNVILWSGVELADYPKISVTLQKEGGGPASSGRVMLVGHVPEDLR
ncbi:anti-sigma factor [Streptomyces sp. NPDC099088]|uniref:anti-sigma factor n=1 Tax=Streptomyces sp. NPDC099088 TaxID=3366101 RepID=UPI00380E7812